MSHKPTKVITASSQTTRGVLYRDYEEDSRGRRLKSKPYRKRTKPSTTIVQVANTPFQEEPLPIELPAPEPDFEGTDLADFDLRGFEDNDSSTARKTPNENMRDWLAKHFPEYLTELFRSDAAPLLPSTCMSCAAQSKELYSCRDCVGYEVVCSACLSLAHRRLPTHRITHWNGIFWERTTLHALGLVIPLCRQAKQCNNPGSESTIWVGDRTGFQNVNVRFCSHTGSGSKSAQLLSIGLVPCSDKCPESAFTLSLLEHFDLCSTIGAMTAQKYYNVLAKETNAAFPHGTNRYRELIWTHRRYCHLKNVKRSGRAYPAHELEKDRLDHVIQCMCCPAPGFNYEPDDVCDDELPFFRVWISYDGNFQNSRKAKKVDKDDICFSDGQQYYVEHEPYEAWAKMGGNQREKGTKPECDNHKAGRSDTYGIWGGLDVTGIGAFTCTRHTVVCAKGLVDYYGGEKFRFGDYAFASLVQYKTAQGPCTFGMTYDIWCQWIVNLIARSTAFPPHIRLPNNLDLIGGIPKWHLVGHKPVCAIRYSLNYMKYCGRMDGEGPERFWSYLNETAGSTSEKSPGARRDSINNIVDSWNFSKLIGLHQMLPAGFKEAKKMFLQQRQVFQELDNTLPADITKAWSQEPVEAMLNEDGKWRSPFHMAENEVVSFQKVLRQHSDSESTDSHLPAKRPGVAQWIASGIKMENEMQKVRKLGSELGTSITDEEVNSLRARKSDLWRKIKAHQDERSVFVGDIAPPDHPDRRTVINAEPEHVELGLPSSYTLASLNRFGLGSMIDLEISLRRAYCDQALQTLRDLLGIRAAELKFKKKNLRGRTVTTKAEAKLKEHSHQLATVQWKYNNSRAALLRLGLEGQDLERYRPLASKDLKYLQLYLDDESGKPGEGHRVIPWLWRSSLAPNSQSWQTEALKVEWFRSRERYARWEEELKLLKRDMVMANNSLRSMQSIWQFKSTSPFNTPGMSEYAGKTAHMYGELADQVYKACILNILDPVVELKWASHLQESSRGGDSKVANTPATAAS